MKRWIAGFSMLALTACATGPASYEFDNSVALDSDFDTTWESVIDFFSSRNIAVQTIERDSGIIYAERMYAGARNAEFARYADCGENPWVAPVSHSVSFNIFVRETDSGGSRVTVNATFNQTAMPIGGGVMSSYECNSRGRLEQDIIDAVRRGA